uniref:uncharacterized protein n=1 Tax=Myxine glutinosa TaxID=7769 RepID=UPI00358F934D
MVREGLTTRLDEVIEVMETKDRQVRTHMETVKVALEDELEETYRGIKEVKHKLEEVEEGMSEIKKRRRGDKKEIKEEIKELVQSLCLDRDDVLINRMRDSQVMEEKRRGRGPGVSGDQYGRAYDAPGDLISLGVEIDPGGRERPLVKCATGLVCENGGVQESPTLGCVRKKCVPRSECAGESESVVACVRGSTWERGVVSVTEGVTGECARERCVTDRCMRKECAVRSKEECPPVVSVTEVSLGTIRHFPKSSAMPHKPFNTGAFHNSPSARMQMLGFPHESSQKSFSMLQSSAMRAARQSFASPL